MPRLRRPKAALATGATLLATVVAVTATLTGCIGNAPPVDTVGAVDFDRPLAIPPLAESTVAADGTRVFDLTAQAGSTEFRPGLASPTWHFETSASRPPQQNRFDHTNHGPTLRASRGERVKVDVRNQLPETTTVHWHGMHLPAAMDGGPHQAIDPGATWSPAWTIDQPAATLWYHPHPHGATEDHVRMGLAGLFLLDDPIEQALPLPREYGVDVIPVIVQDVEIDDEDGELEQRDGGFSGHLGDEVLVNGTLGPYLDVATEVVRLRLVNASTARIYAFAFDDGREFAQIASDGGLLEAPLPTERVQLSPGERAEVLVRMAPGETAVLRSEKPDLGGTIGVFGGGNGGGDRFDVLELRAADELRDAGTIPESLTDIERLDAADAVQEREWVLDGTQINQSNMDMDRIDAVAEVGTTEVWNVRNNMAFPHNFHVHDVQFQVLAVNGAEPPPALAGWKDTVYVRPNETVRLIMRFDDYADAEHPYMFHCHLLRHEDNGMMGQFLVVEPGADLPAGSDAGGETTTMMGDDHDHGN